MSTPKELRSERSRWNRLAEDPYYAVLNSEENRLVNLPESREQFHQTGAKDIGSVVSDIRAWIDPAFAPVRTLDFGCGVGRLVLPLARLSKCVLGVDISEVMLRKARKNVVEAGLNNATFMTSEAFFEQGGDEGGPFDFIHSYIVLQHIPPAAGLWFTEHLIRRLCIGGVGALHFTYARHAPLYRRLIHRIRRSVNPLNILVNAVQRRPLSEPMMPMYEYELPSLLNLVNRLGCESVHARFHDHGGHLGIMLIFQRTNEGRDTTPRRATSLGSAEATQRQTRPSREMPRNLPGPRYLAASLPHTMLSRHPMARAGIEPATHGCSDPFAGSARHFVLASEPSLQQRLRRSCLNVRVALPKPVTTIYRTR